MARNVGVQHLRGVKANIPTLEQGELYLATDEVQVYVGTASGNELILLNTVGTPNGSPGQSVTVSKIGTGTGPASTTAIVGFTKIIIRGVTYWMPLFR
jgi:hypothetical protein